MACPECYRTRSWKAFKFDSHILNVLSWKEITSSIQSLFLPLPRCRTGSNNIEEEGGCFPHCMGVTRCNLIWVTHCSAITSHHHKVQVSERHQWEPRRRINAQPSLSKRKNLNLGVNLIGEWKVELFKSELSPFERANDYFMGNWIIFIYMF